jgi:hypothetical protein
VEVTQMGLPWPSSIQLVLKQVAGCWHTTGV